MTPKAVGRPGVLGTSLLVLVLVARSEATRPLIPLLQSAPPARTEAKPPLWTESLASDVEALTLTVLGSVLVSSKAGLVAIQPSTGKQIWSRPDIVGYSFASATSCALAHTRDGGRVVIDLETGRDKWNLSSLKFTKQNGLRFLADQGVLLVWGQAATPHVLVAVNFESGEVLWRQDSLFSAPDLASKAAKVSYNNVGLDKKVLVLAPTQGGLLGLDPESGRLLWRATDKNLIGGDVSTGQLTIADGRVFLAHKETVYAVGASDGRFLWKLAQNFPRPVVQMQVTQKGLLVRGAFNLVGAIQRHSWDPYLALLEPHSGNVAWSTQKQSKDFEGRSSFLVRDDKILIAHKTGLQLLDLATGRELIAPRLPESEGDDPCCLEEMAGGKVLISSGESLRLVDQEGKMVYNKYYKAPGASFLAKFASVAVIAAQGAAAGASPTGGMVFLGSASVFTRKYRALGNADQFTYLFTESPDASGRAGFSLVRLAKETGAETGRVWFVDRNPNYVLDPVSGIVVVGKDKVVFAMGFPATNSALP